MKRALKFITLMALLCASVSQFSTPAFARQGGGGGGGNGGSGGSGGGSGGGGGVVLTTATITMKNSANLYNGVLPQGSATFIYTKNGLPQSLDIQISNINVPDGAVVTVQAVDALRVTGRCWHYEYYSYPMTVMGRKGSLSFSTSKGDFVPFLDPKKGFTDINISPDFLKTPSILTALLPFKGIL